MTAATLEGIKTIPAIPRSGEQYLSVNMALVSLTELVEVATELGFSIEIAQITYPIGSSEIHALLWEGMKSDAPSDMNERIDALADRIPTVAIRSVRGGWSKAA